MLNLFWALLVQPWDDKPPQVRCVQTFFLPLHVGGEAANRVLNSDQPFQFERDLGIERGLGGFIESVEIEINSGAFLLIDISSVWFDGKGVLPASTSFGGSTYPAGTGMRSEGYAICVEFAPLIRTEGSGPFRANVGPSILFFTSELHSTAGTIDTFAVFEGLRVQLLYNVCPAVTLGADLGLWFGGREEATRKVSDALGPLARGGAEGWGYILLPVFALIPIWAGFAEPAWAWLASPWASIRVTRQVHLRIGYYHRGVSVVEVRSDFGGEAISLNFSGPILSLEIRF